MEINTNKQTINLLQLLKYFLNYWYLFVISGVFFIAMGLLYYHYAPKTFKVDSKVSLISEQVNRTRSSNTYVNVNDMMNMEKDFADKIEYMRSSPLLREVIEDLDLFTTYYIQEDKIPKEIPLGYINLYKDSPFIVIVNKDSWQPLSTLFYLRIIDETTFIINASVRRAHMYNFETDKSSVDKIPFSITGTYEFGEEITNANCSFKVLLNSNYHANQYLGKDLFFKFNSPKGLTKKFQNSLTINSAFYKSSITNFTLEWDNIALATDLLNHLIEKYTAKNLDKKNQNANNTLNYIDLQLSNISGNLGQSEQQLQNFRKNQDMMDIDQKSNSIANQVRSMEIKRDELETRMKNFERLNENFRDNSNSATFIAPSYGGMSDLTTSTLIGELTTLDTERQYLISSNQLLNPRLKTLEASIIAIKKVIMDNTSFNLVSIKNELNELNKKLKILNREYSNLPQAQRQLVGLQRDFNLNDAVYTSLLERRVQAQIIMASNVSDIDIIEPVAYTETTNPSIKKIALIALFLGMFFPTLYVIFTTFLTNRIKSIDELKRISNLSSLGVIPHNDSKYTNVVSDYPQSPISEAFHSIRSSIVYYLYGEKNKCILVTSSNPNEGKTFNSLNLATSFAMNHSKTVLVNFDLRKKSKIYDELSQKPLVGLSSYLINNASIEDITIKTDTPNLDFIQSGETPPNPVALISTERTKILFETLKKKYDYIIVDSPPYALVTDTFLLMNFMDLNVFISRFGETRKKMLKQTLEDFKSKKIKNIFHLYNDIAKYDKAYNEKYAYGSHKKGFSLSKLFKKNH